MSTQYQPRYPESHTYDSLTDLLSDGFPEDTPVYVFQDGTPTATTRISELRAQYQRTAPASFAAPANTYYEAPDGHGASCLWSGDIPVLTEHDVPPGTWPDFVQRMTAHV